MSNAPPATSEPAPSTEGPAAAGGDAPAPPTSLEPLSGRVVGGRWRVLSAIGRGGMGVVYEGQNTAIGKRVALKFIEAGPDDSEAIQRFQREAEAASAVESAHIVHVFDTGTTDDGRPYLVMELLRGESLGARLRRLGRLGVAEAVHITGQILRGLTKAHEAGVVHRDLKPDNIFLVDRDDDPLFVKILDFGISKIARRSPDLGPGTITKKGTILGTPFYMSPEQAQGQPDLDGRSDLFSVGAILFECLAGRAPCADLGTYEAVIVAICSRDAPDVRSFAPDTSSALAGVIRKALQRDRGRRFALASDFLDALRAAEPGLLSARGAGPLLPALAATSPADAPPTRTSWITGQKPPRTLNLGPLGPVAAHRLAALGLGVAAAAFLSTFLWLRSRQPADPPALLALPSQQPAPEVTLRLEVSPAHARVTLDGRELTDGLLRGPALSEHELLIEADGYQPVSRRERLDGRPVVRVELLALPAVTISSRPSASTSAAPPSAPRPSSSSPPRAVASASPAASSKGLQLKEKL